MRYGLSDLEKYNKFIFMLKEKGLKENYLKGTMLRDIQSFLEKHAGVKNYYFDDQFAASLEAFTETDDGYELGIKDSNGIYRRIVIKVVDGNLRIILKVKNTNLQSNNVVKYVDIDKFATIVDAKGDVIIWHFTARYDNEKRYKEEDCYHVSRSYSKDCYDKAGVMKTHAYARIADEVGYGKRDFKDIELIGKLNFICDDDSYLYKETFIRDSIYTMRAMREEKLDDGVFARYNALEETNHLLSNPLDLKAKPGSIIGKNRVEISPLSPGRLNGILSKVKDDKFVYSYIVTNWVKDSLAKTYDSNEDPTFINEFTISRYSKVRK